MRSRLIYCLFFLWVGTGCTHPRSGSEPEKVQLAPSSSSFELRLDHAQNFTINYLPTHIEVTVIKASPNAPEPLEYLLVPKGEGTIQPKPNQILIEVPVQRIVCTSTSHVASLDLIGGSRSLAGFPNLDFITTPGIRSLINAGDIRELGPLSGLNYEALIELDPDLVVGYGMGRESETFKKVGELGIPVIMNADYLETSPLGRAEWIKFMALLLGKEREADSVFQLVARNYDSLKSLASQATKKPSVFSGILYGDTWFMPGGNNYGAVLFNDAGASFMWEETDETGWIELSYESVFETAHQADKWLGVASFLSLEEMSNSDHRYSEFKAFKTKNVYNYNGLIGEKGGYAYFELGYMRPDIVLADLIKIFHPHQIPDHNLYFYKKLE